MLIDIAPQSFLVFDSFSELFDQSLLYRDVRRQLEVIKFALLLLLHFKKEEVVNIVLLDFLLEDEELAVHVPSVQGRSQSSLKNQNSFVGPYLQKVWVLCGPLRLQQFLANLD